MSDESGKTTNESTETTTRTDTRGNEESEGLSPQEEKVLRARHGLAEGDDHRLSFGLGADDETEQALARLESFLVEMFEERSSGEHFFPANRSEEGGSQADNAVKRKIIDALKDEQGE